MKRAIVSPNAPAPIGPYNQAILAGNTLYLSGQIALDHKSGELRLGNVREETRLVMENIGAVLREAGFDYADLVKCSIFLSDMNLFSEVNEVYASYFENLPPARETVAVKTLPKSVNVEISGIAVKFKA